MAYVKEETKVLTSLFSFGNHCIDLFFLKDFFFNFYFFHMSALPACIMCITCVPGACRPEGVKSPGIIVMICHVHE